MLHFIQYFKGFPFSISFREIAVSRPVEDGGKRLKRRKKRKMHPGVVQETQIQIWSRKSGTSHCLPRLTIEYTPKRRLLTQTRWFGACMFNAHVMAQTHKLNTFQPVGPCNSAQMCCGLSGDFRWTISRFFLTLNRFSGTVGILVAPKTPGPPRNG